MYTDYDGDDTCTVVLTLRKKVIGVYHYQIENKSYSVLGKSDKFYDIYYKLVYARKSPFQEFATLTFSDNSKLPPLDVAHVQSFLIVMLTAYINAITVAKDTVTSEVPTETPSTEPTA